MLHLEHIPVRKGEWTRHARKKIIIQTGYLEGVDETLLGDRVVALGAVAMVTKPERMTKQKGFITREKTKKEDGKSTLGNSFLRSISSVRSDKWPKGILTSGWWFRPSSEDGPWRSRQHWRCSGP